MYTALCENLKLLDTAAHVTPKERKEPTHPNPAQQEWVLPVDDAVIIAAHHLQNTALLYTINHMNAKDIRQPTSNPQNSGFNNEVRKDFAGFAPETLSRSLKNLPHGHMVIKHLPEGQTARRTLHTKRKR